MPEPHAYVGRAACGCIRAAVTDDQDDARWTASRLAEIVRRGLAVERLACEAIRRATWTRPDCAEHARGRGGLSHER